MPEETWVNRYRPGFFGRRRDEIIAGLNVEFGKEGWRLRWLIYDRALDFKQACQELYEESYYQFLRAHPELVEKITAYKDVYDNAETNVQSGLDYEKQEAYSTHIQDIAIRNALDRLGAKFHGTELAQVRGPDSVGWTLGLNPGQVPFFAPETITKPSIAPRWALPNSVEDFWQSNKWVQIRTE